MLKLNNFSYHYRILFQISPVEAETMVDTENQPAVANGGGGNGDAASPLEKRIIRQIEYYFGDYNLPRDKFLQVGSSTNFAGFALVSWEMRSSFYSITVGFCDIYQSSLWCVSVFDWKQNPR